MELAIAILGIVGAVIGFAVPILRKRLERKDRADTAIGKRDRDELRAGLDELGRLP